MPALLAEYDSESKTAEMVELAGVGRDEELAFEAEQVAQRAAYRAENAGYAVVGSVRLESEEDDLQPTLFGLEYSV